jgi:hypothetical protein
MSNDPLCIFIFGFRFKIIVDICKNSLLSRSLNFSIGEYVEPMDVFVS